MHFRKPWVLSIANCNGGATAEQLTLRDKDTNLRPLDILSKKKML